MLFGFLPIVVYASVRGMLDRRHIRHLHHFVVMSFLATSVYYFVCAAALLRSERITALRTVGVLTGFAGVLLIARPWDTSGSVDRGGVGYMLLGSASIGLSFVYARRFLSDRSIEPAALTTYQIGAALLMLTAVTDYAGITAIEDDRRAFIGLVVGLGILGTGVAYILYYVIVARLGAVTASSATYIPGAVGRTEVLVWWS